MRIKTTGRVAKTTGVSLTPEQKTDVMARVDELYPRVNSFSHYVQLLMHADIEYDLIGKIFSGTLGDVFVRQSNPPLKYQPTPKAVSPIDIASAQALDAAEKSTFPPRAPNPAPRKPVKK